MWFEFDPDSPLLSLVLPNLACFGSSVCSDFFSVNITMCLGFNQAHMTSSVGAVGWLVSLGEQTLPKAAAHAASDADR